jgi:hypothetical protein
MNSPESGPAQSLHDASMTEHGHVEEVMSMHCTVFGKSLIASCGLALALAAGACADADRATDELDREAATADRPTGTMADARGHEGAPITVTGCLQKAEGLNNYVLTEVNRPADSVGTSGRAEGDAVEREQIRAAKHAFRLEGDDDDWEALVGKQVRVVGTYEEGSDIWREMRKDDGKDARNERVDIDHGDLAKIDVDNVEKVADACGQPAK